MTAGPARSAASGGGSAAAVGSAAVAVSGDVSGDNDTWCSEDGSDAGDDWGSDAGSGDDDRDGAAEVTCADFQQGWVVDPPVPCCLACIL